MLKRLAIILFFPLSMQGQSLSAVNFFSNDSIPVVYLGIDFTLARLVNDDGSVARVIQSTQFNGINDLMITESKKYDIQEAYRRSSWTVDLKEVEKRNDKADPDSLKSSDENALYRLKEADINDLVSHFNYGTHTGYGILLIVEGMSKSAKRITIWFTLIDMGTKKVLLTDLVEGKLGSGFGFRNYWSSAIKNAIHEVKSKQYEVWKNSPGIK